MIVYLLDAASSLVLATCMLFVQPRPQTRAVEPKSWRGVMQGIRFLRRQPIILSTMTLDMVAVLFGGVVAMLPMFATEVLQCRAPSGSAGCERCRRSARLCMGFILAMRPPIQRGGRTILLTVMVFGVATIVFGLSKSFALSLFALFILGRRTTSAS